MTWWLPWICLLFGPPHYLLCFCIFFFFSPPLPLPEYALFLSSMSFLICPFCDIAGNFVPEFYLLAGFIRVYFSKTKPGSDPPHQAAITSATSATHAWRCKCLVCPAAPAAWIRPRLCQWDFLTHLHKGTDTHFTSHWVGNAAVGTTSSILRPNLHVQSIEGWSSILLVL